ncbi:MAG: two-component regulator propeller domain-containing protein [Bacteroidota bacterium]|nr:two-component regulator propeller domain-containing protein [Bacteroidota bacterium]
MSSVFSQPKRLQFKHLTPDDGLSSSIATSILQDHKGFIWIGTPDGLNRYDGFNFVVYKNNPADSASLAGNLVQTIIEDHNKNLLIGTQKGLCLYDREKDRFLNYMFDKSSPLRGLVCVVSKIAEDSLGNLWLATNVGLIYFNRIRNQIIQFTHEPNNPESLSNVTVESLLIDKKNRLWVTTRKGLNLYLPETGTFKHIARSESDADDLSNTLFTDVIEDREGNIWFGSTEGLYCLKSNSEAKITNLIHYQHDAQDKYSLSINQVKSLYVDYEGNLWIGTENGGINLFDRENQRFLHYRKDDYDPKSLNNESIQSIYKDKTGILWFGTFTGGLNIAVKNRGAIISYQTLPGAPFSLSHNTVTCFLEDHQDQTWVGTDGGGLNLFDNQTAHFLRFNMDNSHLSSNAILCMQEGSNDQIWFGTWAGGLVRFDSKTKLFTSFTTKNSGIQDDNIFAIAEGDNNDLWLGSFEHGLIHYQIKEKKFTNYTPDNSGLVNKMIVKIKKYSNGRFLIGSPNCFQIFLPGEDRFITYMPDPNDANSLSYPITTDILVENDSCVWIGTRDGLNRFNPNTGSFNRYYEKDGLPGSVIKGLVLDQSGVLWVTTNKGVCRFDYKQGKFKKFTKADGLQSNEFSERSILKTKSSALLMGGTKGFNMVYPEKITENKNIPDVLITDLKIFNISVGPGTENSPLIQNITETKNLALSYKQSVLTFYFAVMDFTAPEKNQYAYKMEGFDEDWVYSGNKREATYTNLNPGEYVFRVKGSNNDGVWNETGTSIQITILPPWWYTWWFKLIAIFTIIFIFGFIYLSRVRNLKNQKILLEKLVAIKTTELNDLNASKDKFFSIIAHDLKNPFNAIIGLSEILKEEIKSGDPATMEEFAGLINISAVQTFRLLENLLEWANSQRGKIVFKPIPINLSELFNEEIDMLNDMAKVKNIELKSSFPDHLTIVADKNMLKTILRNLVSNAIKFTHRNGKVEVKAVINNKHAEISVSDNGIGMTNDAMAKLFRIDTNHSTYGTEKETGSGLGLILCKEFVEKHHGKIWVETELGKGSQFKFTLPLT